MTRSYAGTFRATFFLILGTVIATGTINAASPSPLPGNPGIILVELFTSEGCSSCPPADALLRQINGTRTASGQLVVGISEHVTYWNSLGWLDPFSSALFTERQSAYAEAFHLEGVYTPQMVINGTEQIVGSDRAALARAIKNQENTLSAVSLRILSTTVTGDSLQVRFSAASNGDAHNVEILALIVDEADKSNVLRGENSGRTLEHVSVARLIQPIAKLHSASEQQAQIALPAWFRQEPGHQLILFAQAPGNGRILGADRKPL